MAQTNALTYNGYITQVGTLAVVQLQTVAGVVQGQDASFNAMIPEMLNYAELRIQRDADLIAFQSTNTTPYTLTAGNQFLSIPVGDFIIVQSADVVVNNVPTPLLPVTKEFLRYCYSDPTYLAAPQYFAMHGGDWATAGNTSVVIEVGPFPDLNYNVNITGIQRMPSLYNYANSGQAGTNTTFISTWLPDLLVLASMIYITMYQRNFSPTASDPQMGVSYESQYMTLLRGAMTEEARKRFQASAWSAYSEPVAATPTR